VKPHETVNSRLIELGLPKRYSRRSFTARLSDEEDMIQSGLERGWLVRRCTVAARICMGE
jgi:hypothetical protein